jgi:hypothetical protein
MATPEECRAAVAGLGGLLAGARADGHAPDLPDREIGVHLTDLDLRLRTTLRGGVVAEIRDALPGEAAAHITVSCPSELLLQLCDGTTSFLTAWLTGRLSVDAGWRDVVALRKLL